MGAETSPIDRDAVEAMAEELLVKLRAESLMSFQKFTLFPLFYYAIRGFFIGFDVGVMVVIAALLNNLATMWTVRLPKYRHLAAPQYIAGLYVLVSLVSFVDGLLQSHVLWFVGLGPIMGSLTMGPRAIRTCLYVGIGVVLLSAGAEYFWPNFLIRGHPPGAVWLLRIVFITVMSAFGLLAAWHSAKQEEQIRKQREAVEAARAKVQAAADSKSEFLAAMSHEIRTPMNGILGTAQHLAGSGLDRQQMGYTRLILHSGRQLMDVLNAILDLSKIEAHKFKLRDTKVRLDRIFRDVVGEIGRSFSARRLSLTSKGGDRPVLVEGDPSRIEQVLRNLLSVVVRYAQNHPVEVELDIHGDSARFEFRIPGYQLAPDQQCVLENPALALSRGLSESQRLALIMKVSRAVVDLMGGEISVDSDGKGGTCIGWHLHKSMTDPSLELIDGGGSSVEMSSDAVVVGHRVLVVDDNEINLRVAQKQLEQLGCTVVVKRDGLEALKICETERFSAVFMDLQMPKLSGLQATRAIRESGGPNADTTIIAFTANAYDADLDALDAAGMNGHLAKPFRVEALRRLLLKLDRKEISQAG